VTWLVRLVPVGTATDTPESLRRKADEFRRLMSEATEPSVRAELQGLSDQYLERARRLEAAQGWPETLPDRPLAGHASAARRRRDKE
jgi:hypothetical protein